MKKTALLIMVITILSKCLGFARDITLSYFYGVSDITDAYLISITIPGVIVGFIGIGISTGYIPMYSKVENLEGTERANRYTSDLINILMALCTVMLVGGIVFTAPLVKAFAAGFSGETLELAVKFTRIGLTGMYFTGLVAIFNGFLQLKGNYTIPALVGLPLNTVTILATVISSRGNPVIMATGTVLATASQLLLLWPFIRKVGYRHKAVFNFKDKYIKEMVIIALPIILGVSVDQINVLVDRTIASTIAVGGISALNYASRLNGFVQGIFVLSIVTVLYPMISRMAADKNMDGLKQSVSEAINTVNLLVIPATVGMMVLAEPIIELLFGRGKFDEGAVAMTSVALFYYAIGMLGFGLREVLSRAFYSLQDTKTPAINAAIAVVINIILNIVLSRFMGIGGLALATSISAIICTLLLFVSLRKKIGPFGLKGISVSFVKITLASIVMGVFARLSFDMLVVSRGQSIGLFASIGLGAIVYCVLIYFMGIDEVDSLLKSIKTKISKKRVI